MSVHLVTGFRNEEHITSEDQGSFNSSFFGTGQYVMEAGNQCEASIIDNNTVRVLDGDILMMGRHIRIKPNTYEDCTIETGTAGINRNDLIVMEYYKNPSNGIEDAYLNVLRGDETEGTPTDPIYTDGNIITGASRNQMPLYRVKIEGVVLKSIECLFVTIPTYKTLAEQYASQFKEDCKSHLDSLGVLDTMEEVQANTQSNQIAGALALKEGYNTLNANLTWKKLSGWSKLTMSSTTYTITESQVFDNIKSAKEIMVRLQGTDFDVICHIPMSGMWINSCNGSSDDYVLNPKVRFNSDGKIYINSNNRIGSKANLAYISEVYYR